MSKTSDSVKPFLYMSLISGILGAVIQFAALGQLRLFDFQIYVLFWLLTTVDLMALGMVVQSLLRLASNQNLANQPFLVMRSGAWGAIKLVCLGVLIIAISRAKNYPPLAMLLGLANLFVTPVGGMLLWRFFKTKYV